MQKQVSLLTRIRSAIFYVYLPLSAVAIGFFTWPSLFRRDWAWWVGRRWNRQAMVALRLICGLKYDISAGEDLPTGGSLIAVKHQAMWETLALAATLEKPVFVLKKEILNVPFFGWWCKACGFIPVDRGAGAAAMRNMIDEAQDRIDAGHQVIIFPEGTRMPPGETGKYHPGIAGLYKALEMPCIPVAHNSGQYWHNTSIIREAGTITVKFLPAIEPGMKRAAFMNELQSRIESASRILLSTSQNPVSQADHTTEQPVENEI